MASLEGFRTAISGSIPSIAELAEARKTDVEIQLLVRTLTERILAANGRIVHGCHPTFTPIIEGVSLKSPYAGGTGRRTRHDFRCAVLFSG